MSPILYELQKFSEVVEIYLPQYSSILTGYQAGLSHVPSTASKLWNRLFVQCSDHRTCRASCA